MFYYDNVANLLNVKLISSNEDNNIWKVEYKDNENNALIIAGNDYPNIESFTHEMLHLYLFTKDFSTFGHNLFPCYYNLKCNLVKPQETIDGISNAIAHFKMLPIFTNQLNMDRKKFLANFHIIEENVFANFINNYESYIENKKIDFTNFIRYFFDTRYHFSSNLDKTYREYNEQLKSIDNNLFTILDMNCNKWEQNEGFDNTPFFNTLFKDLDDFL